MFNGDPRRTSHASCLQLNFFSTGLTFHVFFVDRLRSKNIYKENTFFDRARCTKYMRQKDEI